MTLLGGSHLATTYAFAVHVEFEFDPHANLCAFSRGSLGKVKVPKVSLHRH